MFNKILGCVLGLVFSTTVSAANLVWESKTTLLPLQDGGVAKIEASLFDDGKVMISAIMPNQVCSNEKTSIRTKNTIEGFELDFTLRCIQSGSDILLGLFPTSKMGNDYLVAVFKNKKEVSTSWGTVDASGFNKAYSRKVLK